MTRIFTDEAETQGVAWASRAALPNQTLWKASLPARLLPNRSIRYANDPAFRASREILGNGKEKDTGLRLACKAGRCFRKASESLLVRGFPKTTPAFFNESTLCFSGATNRFVPIRDNP